MNTLQGILPMMRPSTRMLLTGFFVLAGNVMIVAQDDPRGVSNSLRDAFTRAAFRIPTEVRRYSLDSLIAPAVSVATEWRRLGDPRSQVRMRRDASVGPLERYLSERLELIEGIAAFRFEDTSARVYGARRADHPRIHELPMAAPLQWYDDELSGSRHCELVVEALPAAHASIDELVDRLRKAPDHQMTIRIRVVATPATSKNSGSPQTHSIPLADARALLAAAHPSGTHVLVEGQGVVSVRQPVRVDRLVNRSFVVDHSLSPGTGASKSTAIPILEHVPEGARVIVTPISMSAAGDRVEMLVDLDLAQILKPVRSQERTLPELPTPLKVEIPDTNETTWRSKILEFSPGVSALRIEGIRWTCFDPEGHFDLSIVVLADGLVPAQEDATSGDAIWNYAHLVIALGEEGSGVIAFGRIHYSPPKPGARMRVYRKDKRPDGEVEIVRVDGMMAVVRRLSGPPLAIHDRVWP